jgi:UDP-glucose 4-epimerase
MRILITGAAGLFGIHVVEELLQWEDVSGILGVDDFSRGFPQENELSIPAWGKKIQLMKHHYQEITAKEWNSLNVNIVIHLAGYKSGRESMNTPEEYFSNNEYGTFKLVQTLLRTKTRPFLIFASTTEVYGKPVYEPIDEKHPVNPLNIHAVTKLAAERHIMAVCQWYGYPAAILRFCNTFGENQNIYGYVSAVPSFIDRALRNEPLIIYGSGDQKRDFLYVKDAVKAIRLAVCARDKTEGRMFNIASGQLITIYDLAKKIIEITGSISEIIKLPCEKEKLMEVTFDTELAAKTLSWQPEYSLENGLIRTINWHKSLSCI